MIVLVRFTRGAFRFRLKLDESHPKHDDAGNLSSSGVGNLMGDMFPLVRRGVDIVNVEGDSIFGADWCHLNVRVVPGSAKM